MSERLTTELVQHWASKRADDAGTCARDLLDARDEIARLKSAPAASAERLARAFDNLIAETACVSGDYRHWACQVCGAEWEGDASGPVMGHPDGDCEWPKAVRELAAYRSASEAKCAYCGCRAYTPECQRPAYAPSPVCPTCGHADHTNKAGGKCWEYHLDGYCPCQSPSPEESICGTPDPDKARASRGILCGLRVSMFYDPDANGNSLLPDTPTDEMVDAIADALSARGWFGAIELTEVDDDGMHTQPCGHCRAPSPEAERKDGV